MKIESREIKQLNITAIFEEINLSRINPKELLDTLNLREKDKKTMTIFEAPGVKILIVPTLGKEIIIQQNRFLINDKNSKDVKNSEIIEDFQKFMNKLAIDTTKLSAYGFNYDILIQVKEPLNYKDFAGSALLKTLNGAHLLKAGTRMIYQKEDKKEDKKYDLQTAPAGDSTNFILHLNVHYASNKLEYSRIKSQFVKDFKEINNIIKELG
jgi:hypothetical protein